MIRVKKPFESINDTAAEVRRVHEEREEKPIVTPTSLTSEDVHGGTEITFSIPSPSQQQGGGKDEKEGGTVGRGDIAKNTKKGEDAIEKGNESSQGEDDSDNEDTQTEDREDLEESPQNNGEGGASQDSQSDRQGRSREEDQNQNKPDNGEEDLEESSQNEETEDDKDDEDTQTHTYIYNTVEVVDVTRNTASATKFYQTEFYRFIEMFAEEKIKIFDLRSSDEYNIKKLMLRRYEGRSLNHYKMSRVKDTVVLMLDNSGSMKWWAENLSILADLALQRRDIETYIAPNGIIERRLTKYRSIPVGHESVMKMMKNRKIIYVGDYDGADTAVELSWGNDVVWVCPESRYRRFRAHSWVKYDEEDFRGAFLRVYNLEEMFKAIRMLMSRQHIKRFRVDLHEHERFEDDREAITLTR